MNADMEGDRQCRVLIGDWREVAREVASSSVQCVVTSPPYWNLRDYGVRKQIGLEKTPEEYVATMVECFREVRRVLREDGTCWVNLGDTYAGGGMGGGGSFACDGLRMVPEPYTDKNKPGRNGSRLVGGTIKNKDLVGIPWRVALALQADGWYLRADNIWHKPNPMPESCVDRPTRCHEYVFLLTKSARYYYDAEAIKEPVSGTAHARGNGVNPKAKVCGRSSMYQDRDPQHRRVKQNPSFSGAVAGLVATRNRRTVWSISPAPYAGAHFATFPPKLAEICIRAGTSEHGACSLCGAPWERQLEASPEYAKLLGKSYHDHKADLVEYGKRGAPTLKGMVTYVTTGWRAGCECSLAARVPCVVLDPFAGSGTVGQVCRELERRAVLVELNPEYRPLIEKRLNR